MDKTQLRKTCDFAGYATRYGVRCDDGRVITPGAFAHHDGKSIPLVWRHFHEDIDDVLGHGILENRPDGMYVYGFFNEDDKSRKAKLRVQNKDLDSLSIYANELKEKSKTVTHGILREVSLVLSGKNPGAKIDFVSIQHGDDGDWVDSEDEAIITFGDLLETDEEIKHSIKTEEQPMADKTIGDVFETLTDEQKEAVYVMLAMAIEDGGQATHDALDGETEEQGENSQMKNNVFSKNAGQSDRQKTLVLLHDAVGVLEEAQKRKLSLKEAFHGYVDGLDEESQALIHAGTYGIGSDRANLELLFPDATPLNREPRFITRDISWVKDVLSSTNHTPFARIKTLFGDLTAESLRARGYITANQKVDDVFPILKRVTTPQTIYKKNRLDRDDVIDITDFSIVAWLKASMRMLLDEEIARSVFISDGRSPASDDKIDETHIRPIYGDDPLFVHYSTIANDADTMDFMDSVIAARTNYKGSGNPTLYVGPTLLTAMLLLRDEDGRRMFKTLADLAAELTVSAVKEIPVLDGVTREVGADERTLMAILVNLSDYTHGADQGGQVSLFDDFDIDYNQMKYLIETRLSGALTVPKGAVVIEKLPAA